MISQNCRQNMNLTSTSNQDGDNESDICFDRQDDDHANDDDDDDNAAIKDQDSLDLNSSMKNHAQVKIVQTTTAMPQDLSKSDKNCCKQSQNIDEKSLLKRLQIPPLTSAAAWRLNNGISDDDIFAITAAVQTPPSSSLQITSIDGFFNRKRGRPPKNRFVEVYKNTQQKPQAIFTSFKLERQDLAYATTSTTSNTFLQAVAPTAKDGDSDRNILFEQPRHRPIIDNPTQRKRISRNSVAKLRDDCKHKDKELIRESTHSFSLDSEPLPKKPRVCKTAGNVTVVRAAGTFYPENSIGSAYSKQSGKASDLVKGTSNIFSMGDEVAQNLSLKDKTQIKAENHQEVLNETASSAAMTDASSYRIPSSYNVFQMQQQLFAYYQQIVLMAPKFSQLFHTLGQNASNSPSSVASAPEAENVLAQNKNLFNMLTSQCINQTKSEVSLRQLRNKTTAATKTRNCSQATATTTTQLKNSFQPLEKIPEAQFQYGRENTPSGYLRFRFNEDCGYEKCGYRQHQSHFHCNRTDCQYSFCDKTRFVQHTARHERLDTLMGNDFQQYRATIACNYTNCPYTLNTAADVNKIINNRKSSHFHCLKCQFVCADTNKVVAHRRLHSKMEFIRLAGFRKVSSEQNCIIPTSTVSVNQLQSHINSAPMSDTTFDLTGNGLIRSSEQVDTELGAPRCPYSLRHAHYHCLVCNCSVLSRSQMLAHKHRKSAESTSTQQQSFEKAPTSPENQEAKETKCDLETFKNLFRIS